MSAVLLGLASAIYQYYSSWSLAKSYAVCSDNSIYTVDTTNPITDCLLVRGDRIVQVATRENVLLSETLYDRLLGGLRIYEIEPGQIVVPGLADAHAHVLEYGFKMQLPLDGLTSLPEVIQRVEEYAKTHPDNDTWIAGMGWDQTKWEGAAFPSAKDLDTEVLRGRRIWLNRVDGHATWVSQRILDEAGPFPTHVKGGEVLRDSEGNPTGIFVDNAADLVQPPAWTQTQLDEFFDKTTRDALKHGLTSIHDAGSFPDWIEYFKRKSEKGRLPLRLYAMGLVLSEEYWGSQIPHLINHGKNGRLNVRGIKLFTDGAFGSWGAALQEPYTDKPLASGIMRIAPEKLKSLVTQFYEDGWQVNVHCIGDKANHIILDIYEGLNMNATERRFRIEHAQMMSKADLERLGRLGVIASVQPTHATSDMWYLESRLGPDRLSTVSAYKSQLEVSPQRILPLGSDFPVESVNPIFGFYSAVSRLSHDGTSPHGPGGWFPEQRLTREEALKGMTLDAAYASFAENEIGSLTVGKKADFVVLDRDIMKVPFDQIVDTKVKATVIDGQVAYGSLD